MNRREALLSLGSMAASVAIVPHVGAQELKGVPMRTALDPGFLPEPVHRGGFTVFTEDTDRKTLAAVFDRLMPEDEYGPSASQAGCLEFLDAQLAGPYGDGATMYREKPLQPNADDLMQVPQFIATPRERYESGLAALEAYAQAHHGKAFHALTADQQDTLLEGMESGKVDLDRGVNTKAFFELLLLNVREGYFSDPVYGGNRDMAGWKMIGFPGARYDYRLYADRTGEKLGLEPISLVPLD